MFLFITIGCNARSNTSTTDIKFYAYDGSIISEYNNVKNYAYGGNCILLTEQNGNKIILMGTIKVEVKKGGIK